ncbi:MAG TPA: SDR family oxidoreductase [Candidatus Pelethenecus sp.]|nr:SDR family oxidoreductase [Candidatus Pelethenecus sp.]
MNSTVLITGATSGIGKELSYRFAEKKYQLVLIGRNEEKLNHLCKEITLKYSIQPYGICVDLLEKDSCSKIYNKTKELNVNVDILLNVAGLGVYDNFLDRDMKDHQELLEVNIKSLVTLSHLFGQDMKKRNYGYIINFSSISGFFPGPYMSTYYASKAFVLSFSIALAEELKPFNVSVLALCPGVIQTPFYVKAKADIAHSYLLQRMKPNSVCWVSKKIIKMISKKKTGYRVIGLKNKLLIFISRSFPKKLLGKIIVFVQAKKIN